MLVLSATVNVEDDVVIINVDGIEIEVRLIKVGDRRAEIGYTAPREVKIHRKRHYERIMRENGGEW